LALQRRQKYLDAYILFRQATVADPGNAKAWHNRSCMLGVLLAQDAAVDENELYDALEKALRMDQRYRTAFTADEDLAPVRERPRFIVLLETYGITVYALNGGQKLGYRKNARWVALPGDEAGALAACMAVSGADVYAGGYRFNGKENYDDIQVPGYRKNGTWMALPILEGRSGATVTA
jgi:hypothetical protein